MEGAVLLQSIQPPLLLPSKIVWNSSWNVGADAVLPPDVLASCCLLVRSDWSASTDAIYRFEPGGAAMIPEDDEPGEPGREHGEGRGRRDEATAVAAFDGHECVDPGDVEGLRSARRGLGRGATKARAAGPSGRP